MFFHSCFSSLWHFHVSFFCFESGPWSLGNCHQELFLEPFSFLFIVSFLYRFGYLSFLCLEDCPWKLSKEFFLEPFSSFFRFCIVLAMFPSFALKIDLGNCLEPFSFVFRYFFVLAIFSPLPSKLTLEIVKRRFFSNPFCLFFVFSRCFSVFCFYCVLFHFCFGFFRCFFIECFILCYFSCPFSFHLSCSFFLRVCFHFRFCFHFFVWVKVYVCFPFFMFAVVSFFVFI